jgi:hypothetical protein
MEKFAEILEVRIKDWEDGKVKKIRVGGEWKEYIVDEIILNKGGVCLVLGEGNEYYYREGVKIENVKCISERMEEDWMLDRHRID